MIKNLIKGENPYKHGSFDENNNCINIYFILIFNIFYFKINNF